MININEQVIDAASKKIANSADAIKVAINNVKDEMASMSTVWESKEATEYLELFNELEASFPALYKDLYNLSGFLDGVVKAYREHVNARMSRAVHFHE